MPLVAKQKNLCQVILVAGDGLITFFQSCYILRITFKTVDFFHLKDDFT
ncbi:hypothetical protein N478_17780 [Pseudoalteromonas luteoviolacea S4060-1]|uniref:Uncharacterized protein n=1 Tax=Pseudoalteromonas luteoviolacea S4060-1 TaxID=1365257 RepID=A0A167N0M5_9GAMM|nr:hypothetical protein N478_17780 [Pseudoalteromonas luteoviolacea S4060-1]